MCAPSAARPVSRVEQLQLAGLPRQTGQAWGTPVIAESATGWRRSRIICTGLCIPGRILKVTFKTFPPKLQRLKFSAYCNY